MVDPQVTVRSVNEPEEAIRLAAARLEELISEAVALRRQAHVALCGGETPKPAYQLLAGRLDHPDRIELWFGDERAVGPTDPESNYGMVAEALREANLPDGAIHRVEGERGADEAASLYVDQLTEGVPAGDQGLPVLDVAFQGIGPDGHTASLFPGHPAVGAKGICVPVHDAPKPPPERISLTVPVLRAARMILFLVVGEEKADAVAKLVAGDAEIPAALLAGPATELIADRAALAAAP